MRLSWILCALTAVLLSLSACGSKEGESTDQATTAAGAPQLPQGDEPITLDPKDFTDVIDNPYWPMAPGATWVYREVDADGQALEVKVTVTTQTKEIQGITARVVHDVVSKDGQPLEDTYDWYAEDKWGNIWYLGEETKEYEDGEVVSTAGSWEHGVDGALAGIAVPAAPEVGLRYRQEYYAGEAEDRGEILSLTATADVPFDSFTGVLETKDTTPLEPDVLEHKFYAQGVGPVLSVDVAGGGREELIDYQAPPA